MGKRRCTSGDHAGLGGWLGWRLLAIAALALFLAILRSSSVSAAELASTDASAAITSVDASPALLLKPTSLADRLRIDGDDEFSSAMRAALTSVDGAQDDSWQTLVSENLCGIRPARPNELPAGAFGGMLATADGGVALFDSTRADQAYIASVIVHEAWHHKQFAAHQQYYGPAAESEAMDVQADFLAQIAPGHPGIAYLHDLVTQLPDSRAR